MKKKFSPEEGILIVCEGVDGSGKTTLAQRLVSYYSGGPQEVILTCQPGATEFGRKIRSALKEYYQYSLKNALTEFLLYAADRAQHIQEIIIPALAQKKIVITDRFCGSSIVYQGYLQGLSVEKIKMVNDWTLQGVTPALTLYCRADCSTIENRLKVRGNLETFDGMAREHLQTLIEGYDSLYISEHPNNDVIIIDACKSADEVLAQAIFEINSSLFSGI